MPLSEIIQLWLVHTTTLSFVIVPSLSTFHTMYSFFLAVLLEDFLIAEFPSLVSVLTCLLDLYNGSDSQQTQVTKGQQ